MSNELIIFENKAFGKVRTILINGEPWFVGKDVATALGYTNHNQALRNRVDDEDKKMGARNATLSIKDSLGRNQYPSFINESGLYSLVMWSKLPTAKKFKRWVTSEVLPAIRKTGGDTANAETMTNEDALQCEDTDSFERSRSTHEIININNVRGYLDKENGTAYLNAEDVARGFGFTQEKNGVEYIRWDRVNQYLHEFGFSPLVGKDDFLPENMVYRLGFKASNEAAQKFQAVLADEVLPAIRKHGAYLTPEKIEEVLLNPDTLIKLATELKAEREARKCAELEAASAKQVIGELKPKAAYTDLILSSNNTVPITVIAKDYGMSAKVFNEMLHALHVIYKLREQWLLYAKYQNKGYTHSKTFHLTLSSGRTACKMQTEWTQKGRLFLYQLLKKHGIIPMIERDDTEAEDLEKLR
jgi:prophage antirepressor-like protein